jgi:hypothetical protein
VLARVAIVNDRLGSKGNHVADCRSGFVVLRKKFDTDNPSRPRCCDEHEDHQKY